MDYVKNTNNIAEKQAREVARMETEEQKTTTSIAPVVMDEKGAKCSHNGKHWMSDVDNNVWEPGAYGWTEAEN